ncbi:MAG: hypothetical protein ACSW76_03900 [Bacteroidaceae bacterium]
MNKTLKKSFKIAGITLGSILGLLIIVLALACWIVFSPSKLTKVAGKAIDKYSPARAEVDTVDLTLVGTYPFLGFRLNGLVIYDDMEDSPSDTLASLDKLTVTVDFKSLYKEKKIILTNLFIDGVKANVFRASDGRSNLDVFSGPEEKESTPDDEGMDLYADLQKISVHNINASYKDLGLGADASVKDLGIDLKGLLHSDSIDARTDVRIASVDAAIRNDSTDITANISGLKIKGTVSKYGDYINGELALNLKDTYTSAGDMYADLENLEFILDGLTCSLGQEGLQDLATAIRMSASDLSFSNRDLSTTTGSFTMKADKARFIDDSINVSGFRFDSRSIALNLGDSSGVLSKGGLDRLLLDIDGGIKLDMSNVKSNMIVDIDGAFFNMAGETPLDARAEKMLFSADGSIEGKAVALNSDFSTPSLNFSMGNDVYVPGWPFRITVPMETNMDMDRFSIKDGANLTVDGQQIGFSANGTLGGKDAVSGNARIKTVRDMDLDRLISMIPDAFKDALDGIDVHGIIGLDLNIRGAVGDNGPVLDNARAKMSLRNLDALLNDSLKALSDKLAADITYPSQIAVDRNRQTADVVLSAADLAVSLIDSTTINASFDNLDLNASIAGFDEPKERMNIILDLKAEKLKADMDTIFGTMDNADISITLAPAESTTAMMANIAFNDLSASMGSLLSATLGNTTLHAVAQYDEKKEDLLLKWDPRIKLTLENGNIELLEEPVVVPQLDIDFSLGVFNINDCRVELDNSDIMLWGDVYNIGEFLDGTGLLTGELFMESDFVDVNRIMEITGATDQENQETAEQTVSDIEAGQDTIKGPFMVPKGIDLTLYTNLSEINFNDHLFNNVGGDVTVKDGVVVLQELGFSSKAAEMQLTAIYKTPSIQDRFVELDFHLLDIEIDELIDLIPAVDSIVPMLKAFSGKAQFHLAAETFLDPNTRENGDFFPIMSTLIGAAAIEGKDLVVLDNDIFNGIKKKLLMSKDARNVIDSLDVELQVLRDKVDLYPTRIKMDRYEAIVSGRHNINKDLSCSYNVSLVESPLPIRLGVTVSGPINGIASAPLKHIKVGKAKYDKLYKPSKRGNTEEKVLQMKEDILNTLRGNVRN